MRREERRGGCPSQEPAASGRVPGHVHNRGCGQLSGHGMIQCHIKTNPEVILGCDGVETRGNGLFEYTVSLRLL
jgi:hypothetical protein